MTPKQRIKLMTALWPHAAAAQGWDPRDRARRLAVINAVLAEHPHPARRRIVESASDLDSNTDYTLVKNRLLMLADSLTGALEDGDLKMNALRQRREIIRRLVIQLAKHLTNSSPSHSAPHPPAVGGASVSASRLDAADGANIPAIYSDPRPSPLSPAENYLLKIIHDTTARAGFEPENFAHAPFEKILCALDQPALDHLIITLKNRLRAKSKPQPRTI